MSREHTIRVRSNKGCLVALDVQAGSAQGAIGELVVDSGDDRPNRGVESHGLELSQRDAGVSIVCIIGVGLQAVDHRDARERELIFQALLSHNEDFRRRFLA